MNDVEISIETLIQEEHDNNYISRELLEILSNGILRRMPNKLIEAGHHFSLADCEIRGCKNLESDNRRIYVNRLFYIPNDKVLK